jgi:Aspartyl protease
LTLAAHRTRWSPRFTLAESRTQPSSGSRARTKPNWWASANARLAPRPFPWIFPYLEEERVQGGDFLVKPLLRPVVTVRFVGERLGSQNLAALVDSGSDHTVAAPWIAQDIGVRPDSSREIMLSIGGSPRRVRFADVTVQLLPPERGLFEGGYDATEVHEWQIQVGFFTEWQAPPWNVVLGQVGFFDKFTVTMSRQAQALAISDAARFDDWFPQPTAQQPSPNPRFTP